MNFQEVLSRFTYEDETEIRDRILKTRKEDYRENKDIVNEILLWKINRLPHIQSEVIDKIYELEIIKTPLEAAESEMTRSVVKKLLDTKGVRLPVASTILHFYYPDVYPIIDQRAYRELYCKDYPMTTNKMEPLVTLYIKYIADCYVYQQRNCPEIPFSKIDKILYQLDKEKGFKIKY